LHQRAGNDSRKYSSAAVLVAEFTIAASAKYMSIRVYPRPPVPRKQSHA
jgi:hypothetical protein